MFDLSVRDEELADAWWPAERLDEEMRDLDPRRDERADLALRWFAADHRPEEVEVLAFVVEWWRTWRDRGPSAERDAWFDAFRIGGRREAEFLVRVPARDDDEVDPLETVHGDDLYRHAVDQLRERWEEFRADLAGWRWHPADEESPAVGPAVVVVAPEPHVQRPVEGWVRVVTPGLAARSFHYPTVDRLLVDLLVAGVLGELGELEQVVEDAAASGVAGEEFSRTLWAEVAHHRGGEGEDGEPVAPSVVVDLHLRAGPLTVHTREALAGLVATGARCRYIAFDDVVLVTPDDGFPGLPRGTVTALRIASGARRDGGRFTLAAVRRGLGTITADRGRWVVTTAPGRREEFPAVRELLLTVLGAVRPVVPA